MRLDKLGIPAFSVIKIIEEELGKKPVVAGSSVGVYLSGRMNKLLNNSYKEAQGLRVTVDLDTNKKLVFL